MKYAYTTFVIIMFGLGWYYGSKFSTRTTIREVPVISTKTITETRVVEKAPDGKMVERITTQTKERTPQASTQSKAEYRLGALLPVGNDRLPTISASKRLFGDMWLDAQYDIKHKELLIGFSYEF